MPDYIVKTTIPADPTAEPRRDGGSGPSTRERLVRAENRAQALRHVVADTITIETASIDDAMRIAGQGGKVEQASE